MRNQFAKFVVTGGLWLGLLVHYGQAQIQMPVGPSGPTTWEQDVDAFAPAEMDIDGMTIGRENRVGWIFGFDKMYWSISGERTTVGDRNIARELPPVWADHPGFIEPNPNTGAPVLPIGAVDPITRRPINPDTFLPIQPPIYTNSIHETNPDASFRGADRIEFGFTSEGNGWLVSILHGPNQQQGQLFGTNGGAQEGQGDLQSPLGDVYIGFDYQPGFMHGFQDLWIGAIGTGRVLPADTDGDGILDGDGIADDLDADAQFGPDGFDLAAPGMIPEVFILGFDTPDYDDLVELPTAFRTVLVRNATTMNGIELMGTYRLNNRHFMAKKQNNTVDLYYGVRYLRFRDNFVVNTEGGVLGQCLWDTQIINNVVGPQVGLNWMRERGRWRGMVSGRFTFGYNLSNWDQDGFIGEDLTPGRYNHPLYAQAHSFKYGRTDSEFSPLAELRWGVAYQVTKQIAINAGWTGTYVGNVYRASTHVKYSLPNMGFTMNGPEQIIANGGNIGLEYNY